MGIFFNKKTPGEKAEQLTLAEVGNKQILYKTAGNNRYLVVTEDMIYVGSLGIASGSFRGKFVKRYPMDLISSVDVRKATFTVELEILVSGSQGMSQTNASFSGRVSSENIIAFPPKRYEEVQKLADYILGLRQATKDKSRPQKEIGNIPAQIQQLAQLKQNGIISETEFEAKKSELLSRM